VLIIRGSFRELKPQIVAILEIVDQEFEAVGCVTTVVTSAWREDAGDGSLHTHGYAADFDSAQMPEDLNDSKWQALVVHVKERLGVVAGGPDEYDVLAHGPRAHLHVEFDPPEPADVVSV
jgi:hypothetical protein